jgi:hypothetical protein
VSYSTRRRSGSKASEPDRLPLAASESLKSSAMGNPNETA